jgi:hypothetical protein
MEVVMKMSLSLLRRGVAVGVLALAFAPALPGRCHAENHRHHLGLALGYQKLLSNDLKGGSTGLDFTNAGFGSIGYRLSLLPNLDLTLDSRATVSTGTERGVDLRLTNSFFGPGVRIVSPNTKGIRPFVQANLFLVSERGEAERGGFKVTASDNGAGFGVSAGVDIPASRLLSIPIEADYMYGKPSDDVSGIGVNVGLTFNFGQMPR